MEDHSRPLGHSNASLFASADEMAGTYSPQTDGHNIAPVHNSPAYRVQRSGGAPLNTQPRIDIQNMELHYPMPDKAEVWHQAEHPDTVHKVLNYEGDISMETFKGAAKIFSHANPEQFLLPLEVNREPYPATLLTLTNLILVSHHLYESRQIDGHEVQHSQWRCDQPPIVQRTHYCGLG